MKKYFLIGALMILSLTTSNVHADNSSLGGGISSDAPFAINANVCKLNEGKTMEDYHSLNG